LFSRQYNSALFTRLFFDKEVFLLLCTDNSLNFSWCLLVLQSIGEVAVTKVLLGWVLRGLLNPKMICICGHIIRVILEPSDCPRGLVKGAVSRDLLLPYRCGGDFLFCFFRKITYSDPTKCPERIYNFVKYLWNLVLVTTSWYVNHQEAILDIGDSFYIFLEQAITIPGTIIYK
jgi:hypothetical protein